MASMPTNVAMPRQAAEKGMAGLIVFWVIDDSDQGKEDSIFGARERVKYCAFVAW